MGLTQPILGEKNNYALESDIKAIAKDIIDFADKVYQDDIGFSFDCGFRFCMFTLEQHKQMLKRAVKFKATCSPIIDIGPDLTIWRCFPLMKAAQKKLSDFENLNQATEFYDQLHQTFVPMGNLPGCAQCRYRINQLCSGGCLSRTLGAFQR